MSIVYDSSTENGLAFVLSGGCPETGIGLTEEEKVFFDIREALLKKLAGGLVLVGGWSLKDGFTAVDPRRMSWFAVEALPQRQSVRISQLFLTASAEDAIPSMLVADYAELSTLFLPTRDGQRAGTVRLKSTGVLKSIRNGELVIRRVGNFLDVCVGHRVDGRPAVAVRVRADEVGTYLKVTAGSGAGAPDGAHDAIYVGGKLTPPSDAEVVSEQEWTWRPGVQIPLDDDLLYGLADTVVIKTFATYRQNPVFMRGPVDGRGQSFFDDFLMQALKSNFPLIMQQEAQATPYFELMYGFKLPNLLKGLAGPTLDLADLWPDILSAVKAGNNPALPESLIATGQSVRLRPTSRWKGRVLKVDDQNKIVSVALSTSPDTVRKLRLPQSAVISVRPGQLVAPGQEIGCYGYLPAKAEDAATTMEPGVLNELVFNFFMLSSIRSGSIPGQETFYVPSAYCYGFRDQAEYNHETKSYDLRLPSWQLLTDAVSDGQYSVVMPICPAQYVNNNGLRCHTIFMAVGKQIRALQTYALRQAAGRRLYPRQRIVN